MQRTRTQSSVLSTWAGLGSVEIVADLPMLGMQEIVGKAWDPLPSKCQVVIASDALQPNRGSARRFSVPRFESYTDGGSLSTRVTIKNANASLVEVTFVYYDENGDELDVDPDDPDTPTVLELDAHAAGMLCFEGEHPARAGSVLAESSGPIQGMVERLWISSGPYNDFDLDLGPLVPLDP